MLTRGVRLAVDVGSVRVGLALCDPDGILATPLVTLARDARDPGRSEAGRDERDRGRAEGGASRPAAGSPADIAAIGEIVREHDVVEVVVGLPITLTGAEGLAAASARQYARLLARHIDPVPVVLADERMSTAAATRRLSERGVRGRRRRAVVDQAAAVEILQCWLDARRRKT